MPAPILERRRELRRFGFGFGAALGLLAFAAHRGYGPFAFSGAQPAALSLSLATAALWVAGAAAFAPGLNDRLQRALRAVGLPVARALAFCTLLVFFFGVLTPFGVIARLLGHDPLALRSPAARDSYWRPHRKREKASYFHQS